MVLDACGTASLRLHKWLGTKFGVAANKRRTPENDVAGARLPRVFIKLEPPAGVKNNWPVLRGAMRTHPSVYISIAGATRNEDFFR